MDLFLFFSSLKYLWFSLVPLAYRCIRQNLWRSRTLGNLIAEKMVHMRRRREKKKTLRVVQVTFCSCQDTHFTSQQTPFVYLKSLPSLKRPPSWPSPVGNMCVWVGWFSPLQLQITSSIFDVVTCDPEAPPASCLWLPSTRWDSLGVVQERRNNTSPLNYKCTAVRARAHWLLVTWRGCGLSSSGFRTRPRVHTTLEECSWPYEC